MKPVFRDRSEAGMQLASALHRCVLERPVVLALPRGGVPVAFEVAREFSAPLDLVLVRKVGAPGHPELAAAAVVDGALPELVVNDDVVDALEIPATWLQEQARREIAENERRGRVWLGDRSRVSVAGSTAIVVDDGIATGASVRAALRAVRRREPDGLVLAVPVAPFETLERLRAEVDELVCLATPSPFGAVGEFYDDFRQVADEDVRGWIERADRRVAAHDARH